MLAEEITSKGEIEIERIPTRMIEARSKDLVPIFDFHTRNFPQTRFGDTIKYLDNSNDLDIACSIIVLNDYIIFGRLDNNKSLAFLYLDVHQKSAWR